MSGDFIMGRLKDWLMQRFGDDIEDPEEGPTATDYYRSQAEAELISSQPYPERDPLATLIHRLNHESVNEEEVF